MAGNRQRVRDLLDATDATLHETSRAFDEEYPPGTTPPTPTPPPRPEPIVRVPVGGNVQAALDDARSAGGTLLLAVGTHLVNLVVRFVEDAKPVLITSDTSSIPPNGVRITREYGPGLAWLKSANNLDPVIRYDLRSSDVHLTGLGIASLQFDRTMISFGTDSMTSPDEQPERIVHDRLLMVGDPELGQHRGVMAHCRGYALTNSSLLEMHEEGRDSQCLAAWNGGQYLVLRNNTFEGGAENILFGGGAARTEAMAPKRVLIEGCTFTKNYAWNSLAHKPTMKCLLEIKQLRHGTIRNNIFEHCWAAAWDGTAVAFKCTDQAHDEPWTLTEDITFERNRIRRVGAFFSIVGAKDDGYPTQLMRDVRIADNLVTEMDTGNWAGRGTAFLISNMPENLVIDHNTIVGNGYATSELSFNQDEQGSGFALTNTVLWQGAYGIKGPAGMDAWDWETDLGYSPEVTATARRRHPDRTPEWGPGNEVIPEADWDASLAANYAVVSGSPVAQVVTTDGSLIGCDIASLPPA